MSEQHVVTLALSPRRWALLQAAFPLTEDEWAQMMRVLEAMRPGLVIEYRTVPKVVAGIKVIMLPSPREGCPLAWAERGDYTEGDAPAWSSGSRTPAGRHRVRQGGSG